MSDYMVKGNGGINYQMKKCKGNVPKEFKKSQVPVK